MRCMAMNTSGDGGISMIKKKCATPKFTPDEIRFFKQLNADYQLTAQRRSFRLRILNIALLLGILVVLVFLSGAI